MVTSILITFATSVYLRYRIIKSNNFFQRVNRNADQERRSIRAGRLAEILQEQVKPTLSVFIVGGIDGLFNFLFTISYVMAYNVSPLTQLYIIDFVWTPLQFCQSLSHTFSYGIYNKEVRDKFISFCTTKRSNVTIINVQSTVIQGTDEQ